MTKANPTVADAAALLSQAAMPLMVRARLRPAQMQLQNLAEQARPNGAGDDGYPDRVVATAQALNVYRAQLAADPSSVFAALAEAHTKLTRALNDPLTQYEAMKAAVNDFAAKAKAAYAAVQAQRAIEAEAAATAKPKPAAGG